MITLTEVAAQHMIDQVLGVENAIGIRVGVLGGGCSGFQYYLDFATEEKPDDITFEDKGVTLYVDKKSNVYLNGTTIDYVVDLLSSGFKFINPSASRTCGCGESFSC